MDNLVTLYTIYPYKISVNIRINPQISVYII